IVAAYGSYLAANNVHVSGIFAAVVAGIALRWFAHFPTSEEASTEIDEFWGVLAFVANSLVFLSMGLRIDFQRILNEPMLLAATIALMVAARALFVYGGLPLVRFPASKRSWQHIIAFAGIRGALSLALALNLPADMPFRPMMIDAVFGVVAITLVAQGLAIGPITRRLKLKVI
ncbi:MAG: cation:proton antiporter, partial [Vulcanimicrobiaceae bacterium]